MTQTTRPGAPSPRLHIQSEGSGDPLLLMHGFAGSARNFRPQIRALRDAYRVIAFDARGHARSDAPHRPGAYRMSELVADALRVLDAEGASRAVVGGLSMGAAVALSLAMAHPERVRALILASYPAGPGSRHGFSGTAREFADAIEREGLEAAGGRFVWGSDSGLDARGRDWVRQGFLEHEPHALVGILRELLAELPALGAQSAALEGLEVPALLLAGSLDPGSRHAGEELARYLPQGRSLVVEGAGHVVNLARPDPVNRAILEFLESLPPD